MLAAAILAGTQCLGFRLLAQVVALVATVATIVICGLQLALAIRTGVAVYWFGGWHPHHGVALGISLLLVLMAAIIGFSESGDLFNMFVFFELMTATAIALTAHRSDQRAPLQGALNFGISNAIGGFLVLFGIALLYGRTGALNLAQIGAALAGHRVDGLVVVAFGLIVCGFFVKAAIIPFHFWLADAYASAPTPVCVVFAGVMSEVGLYGVARVYWIVFAGPLGPHAATLRLILVITGAVTALGGALMCLLQVLLKRLLAFATISYMGLFLVGLGLLDVRGLAGTAVFVVADGLVKASLFVCVGILQHRRADANSLRTRGLGRGLPFTGIVFGLAALGLAGMPGFGSFLGKTLIESAAADHPGYGWVPVLITVTECLVGAAVLGAGARAFLGWGPELRDESTVDDDAEDLDELSDPQARTPAILFGPALALMLGGLAIGVLPSVGRLAVAGAARFEAGAVYTSTVLSGRATTVAVPRIETAPTLEDVLLGLVFTIVTVLLAVLVVVPRRLAWAPDTFVSGWRATARRLHELHNGHPGDYVTWLVAGAATLTAVLAATLG
jgi:multicomponent Na+:H+ antiporter subunit D